MLQHSGKTSIDTTIQGTKEYVHLDAPSLDAEHSLVTVKPSLERTFSKNTTRSITSERLSQPVYLTKMGLFLARLLPQHRTRSRTGPTSLWCQCHLALTRFEHGYWKVTECVVRFQQLRLGDGSASTLLPMTAFYPRLWSTFDLIWHFSYSESDDEFHSPDAMCA